MSHALISWNLYVFYNSFPKRWDIQTYVIADVSLITVKSALLFCMIGGFFLSQGYSLGILRDIPLGSETLTLWHRLNK